MFNHSRHLLAGILLIAVSMGFPLSAQANRRATKDQIAQRAQESEELWNSPGSNYAAISSIFIQPGTMKREDVLKRLNPALDTAGGAHDKAALNYLVGEAYYWGGLAELRQTRDQSVVLGLGNKAVAAYLSAWTSVTNVGAALAPGAEQLRQTIALRLSQVLSTEVCGSTLSTNLKQRVVADFIDGLPTGEKSDAMKSSTIRAKVYTNLGIQTRLMEKIPTTMPTNFLAVCEAMDLAIAVGATNEALRFAANLQEAHADALAKKTLRWRQVFALYRDSRDPRAEACVRALAAVEPQGWLDLYDYSVRRDPHFPLPQRRKCLDDYFKGLEAKQAKGLRAYRVALDRLLANGDYDLAVEVADAALEQRSAAGASVDRAFVWRSKAVAHEKRGEKEKAEEAYRQGLGDVTLLGRNELESMFRSGAGTGVKQVGQEGEEKRN